MAPHFKINKEKCRKDGICSRLCPIGIIKEGEDKYPALVESKEDFCISCGHCVAFCPHGAASLEPIDSVRFTPLSSLAPMPSPESLSSLMGSRRSIRSFTNKPVPKDVIMQIIADSAWAPTAKNSRTLRWSIINSPEQIKHTCELMAEAFTRMSSELEDRSQKAFYKALAGAWHKGKDPFLRGAKQCAVLISGKSHWNSIDSAITLSYFELSAWGRGVGCCWAGYLTLAAAYHEPLSSFLGATDGETVGGAQMLGYPLLKPQSVAARNIPQVNWLD